MAHSDTSNFPR